MVESLIPEVTSNALVLWSPAMDFEVIVDSATQMVASSAVPLMATELVESVTPKPAPTNVIETEPVAGTFLLCQPAI